MDLSGLELTPGSVTQVIGSSGAGLSTLAARLRREVPGTAVVHQDAVSHLTYLRDTVVEEVAFGLEQRGISPGEMRARVDAALKALGLTQLSERNPTRLSGGQTRRLAVATVAVLEPAVLVLDDSFAGLDPGSAEALLRLCHHYPHGAVVVLGHRAQVGLRGPVLTLRDGELLDARPDEPAHPLPDPVGRLLPGTDASSAPLELGAITAHRGVGRHRWWCRRRSRAGSPPPFTVGPVELTVTPGRVLWLRGANGAGKTTLLRAIAGLDGHAGVDLPVSLLLQRAEDQVVEHTVADFIGDEGVVRALDYDSQAHPLDLPTSRLRLAQAAAVFAQGRTLVLTDEPDVGLDHAARGIFHRLLAAVLGEGRAVIMTCHDTSFMAEVSRYTPVDIRDLDPA